MDKKITELEEKIRFKITPKGSLGLLALGDIGLEAWRKVKNENMNQESNKEDKN